MTDHAIKIYFWPDHLNGNKYVLVLPNQAGQDYLKTTFLRDAPEVRYETGHWTKSTHIEILLAFANNLLLPYNGKVANAKVAKPYGEEAWLDYYLTFATEEDKLNFLLAWS